MSAAKHRQKSGYYKPEDKTDGKIAVSKQAWVDVDVDGENTASSQDSTEHSAIKLYLSEIGRTLLLKPAEEVELARRIKMGDDEASIQMIQANLRLVVKIAHDYSNFGLPLLDLISEGNIGLIKAVERFDPDKGGKLSTYAAWWIKQSIKRALANPEQNHQAAGPSSR